MQEQNQQNLEEKTKAVKLKIAAIKGVKDKLRNLKKQEDDLKKEITAYLMDNVTPNGEGARYFTTRVGYVDFEASCTPVRKLQFKDEAVEELKRLGFKEAISTIEVVDEQVIEQLAINGELTEEDLSEITEIKEHYRLNISRPKQ